MQGLNLHGGFHFRSQTQKGHPAYLHSKSRFAQHTLHFKSDHLPEKNQKHTYLVIMKL